MEREDQKFLLFLYENILFPFDCSVSPPIPVCRLSTGPLPNGELLLCSFFQSMKLKDLSLQKLLLPAPPTQSLLPFFLLS